MENFLKIIEDKLKKNIKIEKILVLDNSNKHKKHKFFDKDKFHIGLEIESNFLKTKNRIESQRIIMNILKEELKEKIHALEIIIK
tara:strand:+ start:10936 stop:11190 length:255 start_codon:yes stop_codon:yes gene_type:complete